MIGFGHDVNQLTACAEADVVRALTPKDPPCRPRHRLREPQVAVVTGHAGGSSVKTSSMISRSPPASALA
jgi:uncharacterized protein involved in type VI secretion and phage assembly